MEATADACVSHKVSIVMAAAASAFFWHCALKSVAEADATMVTRRRKRIFIERGVERNGGVRPILMTPRPRERSHQRRALKHPISGVPDGYVICAPCISLNAVSCRVMKYRHSEVPGGTGNMNLFVRVRVMYVYVCVPLNIRWIDKQHDRRNRHQRHSQTIVEFGAE